MNVETAMNAKTPIDTAVGYQEVQHTADWAMRVWSPNLTSLFEQAARGMSALQHLHLSADGRQERQLHVTARDPETLMVRFLSELLYQNEEDRLGVEHMQLTLTEQADDSFSLTAQLSSLPILAQSKEIKAVTYHNLSIRPTVSGFETEIVFDV